MDCPWKTNQKQNIQCGWVGARKHVQHQLVSSCFLLKLPMTRFNVYPKGVIRNEHYRVTSWITQAPITCVYCWAKGISCTPFWGEAVSPICDEQKYRVRTQDTCALWFSIASRSRLSDRWATCASFFTETMARSFQFHDVFRETKLW